MSETIRQTLRTFIAAEFLDGDRRDLDDSTHLLRTGIVDSLKMVRLLTFLESDLGVSPSTDQVNVANFSTIERISALVMELRKQRTDG